MVEEGLGLYLDGLAAGFVAADLDKDGEGKQDLAALLARFELELGVTDGAIALIGHKIARLDQVHLNKKQESEEKNVLEKQREEDLMKQ